MNKRTAIICHDLFMSAFAWQFAWWARFNFEFPYQDWQLSLYAIPIVVAVQGAVFFRIRLYRGIWRFASVPDLWNIIKASFFGAMGITIALFIMIRLIGIPRSILVLYPLLLTFFLGGPRLLYRFWKDRTVGLKAISSTNRVLIIGAGRAGDMLVREMLRDGQYLPVGFLDDKTGLRNSEIRGVRVLGSTDDVAEICNKYFPDIIILAIPSATSEQMQRIVQRCEETGVPMRTVPGLNEMVADEVILKKLRDVSIEDLLGREKVELDWKTIQNGLSGRVVLVSGGGGSIGAELCRQISQLAPAKLIVLDRNEYNLYRIEQQLAHRRPSLNRVAILGDVCDERCVEHTLKTHKPDVIFHAAAYKHVPLLQQFSREAVLNNVFGTAVIANAAHKHKCDKFVLISTDKAVSPVNTLGTSKRVAELLCECKSAGSDTQFITVRFGNVLGSDGSAIPLFQEQIKQGGPVTVTHPEISRFFMTIREACELILQVGAMGKGGEVFVLDMGTPIKISYLAEQMIRLAGATPGEDIKIEYTGLRPGEKMYEELFYDFEYREHTSHKKIFLARHPEIDREFLLSKLAELKLACDQYDEKTIDQLLKEMASDVVIRNRTAGNVVSFSTKNI